jgi:hypothetical protein
LPENDEGQLWKKKKDDDRFDTAREGDTLFAPFQCDVCWFINLKGRLWNPNRIEDRLCIGVIRRANLDMFWSREPSTVRGMFRIYEQARRASDALGIRTSVHIQRQPWAIEDRIGFGDALVILWQSLQGGRNNLNHQQFESIRKIRSLATTIQLSRGREAREGVAFMEGNRAHILGRSTTNSTFFGKFMRGCEKRMGRLVKQDAALSVKILLYVMANLENEWSERATTNQRKRDIVMIGSFLMIGFCDALRGNEVFLVEASSLCKYAGHGVNDKKPHVVIPLMGRFKGETGERNVIRVLVDRTRSGLEVRRWVTRLIHVLKKEGRGQTSRPGPAFCDEQGTVLAYPYMNSLFHDELLKVQEAHPEIIFPEVEVAETYNLFRSLKRGATSRASALNYSETLINLNNRWRSTQSNKGKGGLKKMSQLYVDVQLVLDALLEFSASL